MPANLPTTFASTGSRFRKQSAFADRDGKVIDDPDHSGEEDRFILLGLSYALRLLVVVHTLREEGDVIRIISARKATPRETMLYRRSP